MKNTLFVPIFLALSACTSLAEAPKEPKAIEYSSEANLPKGWPTPGPYNEVSEKTYPAYRAAFAENGSFWTLFRHIKKNSIPMTAPVEMDITTTGENDTLKKSTMAFLYLDQEVGQLGADGKNVVVKDVPSMKALSYTWMGARNDAAMKKAKAALDAELTKRGITERDYRLLGYNGPSTPRAKRTHELQAMLPSK